MHETDGGMLTDAQREQQATAFVSWWRRWAGCEWERHFRLWAAGKQLDIRDEWAIQRIVRQELIALNYVTVTDEEAA